MTWISRRDMKQQLDAFERLSFHTTCKVFVTPVHMFATLDEDLYETRASDNQVKSISKRKADREGQTADAIADVLFPATLAVRFRRRGWKQSDNFQQLI